VLRAPGSRKEVDDMATRTDEPGPRRPLTKERVLRAAVALADASGIGSLTMRRLGRRLGVEAMALYKHVANKEEILDGIVDLVVAEIELPEPGSEWKAAMRRRAISARDVLARHAWAVGLLESRASFGPAALRYSDTIIGSLRSAGFSVDMAGRAFWLLDSYIYGHIVQEQSVPFDTVEEIAASAEAMADSVSAEEYPHLVEMAAAYGARGDYHVRDEFEFGLDLILDALDPLRGRG
jgi:AcrR family transcriptional regulator